MRVLITGGAGYVGSHCTKLLATLQLWISEKQRALIPCGSLRARFALGACWSLAGALISRGFMLAASVVCARFLGKEGFGALGMIQSTVGMFGVFAGLGLGLTATKYVAEFRQRAPNRAGRILGVLSVVASVAGIVMGLLLVLLAPYLSATVLAAPHLAKPLAVGAGLVFFGAVNGAQTGALAGFEAFTTIARVNVWSGILSFPLIVFAVWQGGLAGAVWGLLGSLAINWLLNQRALRRECSAAGIPYMVAGYTQELRILYQFSLPALLASIIVGPALWACSALLVRQPAGYAQLGLYFAADKWHRLILFVPVSVSAMALPVLSNLYGSDDGVRFWKVFRANVFLNLALAFAAALVIAALAVPIMSMYGQSFRSGWPALMVLSFTAIPEALNAMLGQSLVAARYMWWRFGFDVLLVAVLVALAWFLIPRWGALGLAVSYLSAFAVTSAGLFLFLRQASWEKA